MVRFGSIYAVTLAERIKAVRAHGMALLGERQRIDDPLVKYRRALDEAQFGIEKTDVKAGVMDDQHRVANELQKLIGDLREDRLVLQKRIAQSVNRLGFARHVALGIDKAVVGFSRGNVIEQLNSADFHKAVALQGIKPGCFRIEYNFSHGF